MFDGIDTATSSSFYSLGRHKRVENSSASGRQYFRSSKLSTTQINKKKDGETVEQLANRKVNDHSIKALTNLPATRNNSPATSENLPATLREVEEAGWSSGLGRCISLR